MKVVAAIVLTCLGFTALAGEKNVQSGGQSLRDMVIERTHYYGVGWQRDGQHWSIEVLINADGGQIAYPSLECTGTWTLRNENADHIDYVEQIIEGVDDCLELGIVRLSTRSNGRLDYTWFENEPTIEARAVLIPSGGERLSYMEQLRLTLGVIDIGFMYPEYLE